MRYAELIQLYFERSTALQGYWTLYVVIVGGLLAFSSLRQRRDFVTGVLVTVLFCFFAYKNLDAIHDVTMQRAATVQAIQREGAPREKAMADVGTGSASEAEVSGLLEPTLVAPAWDGVRDFHVASDVLTVLAVWAMELRRIRNARKEMGK